jgi:hypothetical protein
MDRWMDGWMDGSVNQLVGQGFRVAPIPGNVALVDDHFILFLALHLLQLKERSN